MRQAPSCWLKTKKSGISGAAPVPRFEPGHCGISGMLDSDDPSLEINSWPAVLDDLAELTHSPLDGFAAVRAGYSRSLSKGEPHYAPISDPSAIDVLLEGGRNCLLTGEGFGFLF